MKMKIDRKDTSAADMDFIMEKLLAEWNSGMASINMSEAHGHICALQMAKTMFDSLGCPAMALMTERFIKDVKGRMDEFDHGTNT